MQRYMIQTGSGLGGPLVRSDFGALVLHSDAAAQLAAKDAEIEKLKIAVSNATWRSVLAANKVSDLDDTTRRLALAVAEVKAWRAFRKIQTDGLATTDADAVIAAFAYADTLSGVDDARAATDADPVLRAMVEKGSA